MLKTPGVPVPPPVPPPPPLLFTSAGRGRARRVKAAGRRRPRAPPFALQALRRPAAPLAPSSARAPRSLLRQQLKRFMRPVPVMSLLVASVLRRTPQEPPAQRSLTELHELPAGGARGEARRG
jgi:hypothetical protein